MMYVLTLLQYPAYDSFLDSVREEAIQNVKRLRHHPSVVIFGGKLCVCVIALYLRCDFLRVQLETTKVPYLPNFLCTTDLYFLDLDYQIAESLNLQLDYLDETSDYRQTNFPARHIYERLLPSIVEEHSNIHYHRASPYSGQGKATTDRTLGDIHQCTYRSCEDMAWLILIIA